MNLAKNSKVTQVLGYYSAAQTTRNSAVIDMQGYEGVMFIALFDTLIATGTLKLSADQGDTTSPTAELAGSTTHTITTAEAALTGKTGLVLDVYKPEKRYLRASIDIAGSQNAVIGGIVAIQYNGKVAPPSHGVMNADTLVSPAEA
ncbi:MAG: hypothetical protein WC455_14490 [Dehalococcoidia bacterium]|jgi:hypothetical protein